MSGCRERGTPWSILKIKSLVIFSWNIGYIRPFTLIILLSILARNYWSNSKSISGPRHQICDDTFMCFSFIDLPELLYIIDFDTDSVLQNVYKLGAIFANLWVLRVTPCHLYGSWRLSYHSKYSFIERVSFNLHLMFFHLILLQILLLFSYLTYRVILIISCTLAQ